MERNPSAPVKHFQLDFLSDSLLQFMPTFLFFNFLHDPIFYFSILSLSTLTLKLLFISATIPATFLST